MSSLVGSNRAPYPEEERAIRAFIRTADEARTAQIARAHELVDDATVREVEARTDFAKAQELLETAQRKLEMASQMSSDAAAFLDLARQDDSRVAEQRLILHPLRRLPAEVLSRILTLAVAGVAQSGTASFAKVRSAPYYLSWVCQRWRGVALHTPAMWTVIPLALDLIDGRLPLDDVYEEYLDTSIARAGTRLLELRVDQTRCHRVTEGLLSKIGDMVTDDRLRKLDWRLCQSNKQLTPLFPHAAVHLEELHLDVHVDVILPRDAPNLRTVAATFNESLSSVYTSVRSVTMLPRSRCTHTSLFSAFPQATEFLLQQFTGWKLTRPLTHHHVRSLRISSTTGFRASGFKLDFPCVQDVTIEVGQLVDVTGILALLSNACKSVRRLAITVRRVAVAEFILGVEFSRTLRSMPSLESFSCYGGRIESGFFAALELRDPWVCPRLARLDLKHHFPHYAATNLMALGDDEPSSARWEALLSCAEARKSASRSEAQVTQFTRIKVDLGDDASPALASRLSACLA